MESMREHIGFLKLSAEGDFEWGCHFSALCSSGRETRESWHKWEKRSFVKHRLIKWKIKKMWHQDSAVKKGKLTISHFEDQKITKLAQFNSNKKKSCFVYGLTYKVLGLSWSQTANVLVLILSSLDNVLVLVGVVLTTSWTWTNEVKKNNIMILYKY